MIHVTFAKKKSDIHRAVRVHNYENGHTHTDEYNNVYNRQAGDF